MYVIIPSAVEKSLLKYNDKQHACFLDENIPSILNCKS